MQLARDRRADDAEQRPAGCWRSRTAAPRSARPSGLQRPRIIAASAMKPLPAVISLPKASPEAMVKNAPPRPATAPPRTVLRTRVAVDLDADGVGRLGVLADGAHPQAPAACGTPCTCSSDRRRRTSGRRARSAGTAPGRGSGSATAAGSRWWAAAATLPKVSGLSASTRREQVAGQADDQHVEHDADDDLVDQVADREEAPAAGRPGHRRPAPRPARRRRCLSARRPRRPGTPRRAAAPRWRR